MSRNHTMGLRKEKFSNGEIYHIVIRALDDNVIFKDIDDYYRGIFSVYEFNNAKAVVIRDRRQARSRIKKILRKDHDPGIILDSRDRLVEILNFNFMPNHPHLLVKQIKDGGITKFMRKFGTGYSSYFNRKYNRKGHVFQNKFKAILIKNEEQLKVVWAYISANPISLIEPKWKEKGIKKFGKIKKFLKDYKWSGYPDYIGKNNFPSVTNRKLISDIFGGNENCEEFLTDYIKYRGKVGQTPDLLLE